MSDSIRFSADQRQFDIDFSVPLVHRLRFTENCLGSECCVLQELLEASSDKRARVQVWIDEGLAVSDPGLRMRFTERLQESNNVELVSDIEFLQGGEQVKNDPSVVEHLLASFHRDKLDRRSYVIAVGGGAVLDAIGFAAAIAHRGIRLVRLPTTTLGQADSGVGVKNAVNWFGSKNWKGTFATPWAVVNDEKLLDSLGDRDFNCGFSEAVKVALLKDANFFDFLYQSATAIAVRAKEESAEAIRRSALLHVAHITRGGDPFELRQARPLDFGHWSAHKLETMTDYTVRHGEAVSIGVAVDVAYSHLRLGLSSAVMEKTLATLAGLQLPIWHSALNHDMIFDGLEEFRQHLGGELTVTMIRDLEEPVDVHDIDRGAMREAMGLVAAEAYKSLANDDHGRNEGIRETRAMPWQPIN